MSAYFTINNACVHYVYDDRKSTYSRVNAPVHAADNQPCKLVLNRLQLTVQQPTAHYLNVSIRWTPQVQRQTSEQEMGHLHTHTNTHTYTHTYERTTRSFTWTPQVQRQTSEQEMGHLHTHIHAHTRVDHTFVQFRKHVMPLSFNVTQVFML